MSSESSHEATRDEIIKETRCYKYYNIACRKSCFLSRCSWAKKKVFYKHDKQRILNHRRFNDYGLQPNRIGPLRRPAVLG